MHRRRDGHEGFRTSIVRSGWLDLKPPGLALDVGGIYAGLVD